MAYFSDADARILADRLQSLQSPVRLAFFTQSLDCDRCPTTKGILDGLAAASPLVTVDERNLVLDKELAEAMGIERVPAVAIVGQVDAGVRFYGAPEGYELVSLLDAILAASANDSGLSAATRERVKGLTEPLHLQVFSTPTWPHCPRAVALAARLALESPVIRASSISAVDYPDLVRQYHVTGVPKTIVNGHGEVLGALPEAQFLEQILACLEAP